MTQGFMQLVIMEFRIRVEMYWAESNEVESGLAKQLHFLHRPNRKIIIIGRILKRDESRRFQRQNGDNRGIRTLLQCI